MATQAGRKKGKAESKKDVLQPEKIQVHSDNMTPCLKEFSRKKEVGSCGERNKAFKEIEEGVLSVQQGDPSALASIVERYEPLIRHLARRLQVHDFEDACQEGRLAVVMAVLQFDPERGCFFGAFVKRRVWSAVRTWQRREWRWQKEHTLLKELEEGEDDWWEQIPDECPQEPGLEWEWLLDRLSKREELVIRRHVWMGYSMKELAQDEQVSVETVKTWKKRAMKKLREQVTLL